MQRPTRSPLGDRLVAGAFQGLGGSLEQRVQELADREEIRELAARYSQRVLRGLSPADLFTDDGVMVISIPGLPRQEVRGREALEKVFAAAAARPMINMPAVHNQVISIDGDEAIGSSMIELQLSDETADDGRVFAATGIYEDRLRRVDGRWKFASREAHAQVVGPAQRGTPLVPE